MRAEVFGAFGSAVLLWVVSLGVMFESWERISEPPSVDGPMVMVCRRPTRCDRLCCVVAR